MRRDASDRHAVRTHIERVRETLGDPRLADVMQRAAAQVPGDGTPRDKITALLSPDITETASSGGKAPGVPYLSRAPLVSLVQSHLDEALGSAGVPESHEEHPGLLKRIIRAVEHDLHIEPGTFTPDDPDWYVYIAMGSLERLADGNSSFNEMPAEYDDLADDARLLVVGDWGTALPRARDVATLMRVKAAEALADGRQVHVVHLGDIYYSGLETEDRRRFLGPWPVTPDQAEAGVTSWSLNGNHDMYSGGFGYFGTVLGDPRFRLQRSSDGRPSSFFRLRSPSWDFIGLDTAWDPEVTYPGRIAVLQDPQGAYVAETAAASSRRLVLFSHHQLVSYYAPNEISTILPAKLAPVLTANRVTAWWWGHEHRAITYQAAGGVRYPRCLGHGGVPVLVDPEPPPGSTPAFTWHNTRTVREVGQRRARHGFAVLDLRPDRIEVTYVDDDGQVAHTETIT